jgi:hypothetical protein
VKDACTHRQADVKVLTGAYTHRQAGRQADVKELIGAYTHREAGWQAGRQADVAELNDTCT